MKRKITFLVLSVILSFMFSMEVKSQDIFLTPSSVNTEFENNSVRAKEIYGSYKGKDVSIEGKIAHIESEIFQSETYSVFLFDKDENSLIKVTFSTGHKDMILKLNKGENFNIKGSLMYFDILDKNVYVFAITPSIINGESLIKGVEYSSYEYSFSSDQFSYEEYEKGAQFNTTYSGKVVKISGKIEDIGNGVNGLGIIVFPNYKGPAINNKTGSTQIYMFSKIECFFPYAFTSVDKQKIGSSVNIIGVYKSENFVDQVLSSSSLKLTNCTFSDDSSVPQEQIKKSPSLGQDATIRHSDTAYQNNNEVIYHTYTDIRDGQNYKYIEVGNKLWMAENFKFIRDDSFCYEDNSSNCETYGRLYTWEAAKKNAPLGWKIPSIKDWEELIKYFGGKYQAAKNLTLGGKSGMNLLWGGDKSPTGIFENIKGVGLYWSSDINKSILGSLLGANNVSYYIVNYNDPEIHSNKVAQTAAFSVRYVKEK